MSSRAQYRDYLMGWVSKNGAMSPKIVRELAKASFDDKDVRNWLLELAADAENEMNRSAAGQALASWPPA